MHDPLNFWKLNTEAHTHEYQASGSRNQELVARELRSWPERALAHIVHGQPAPDNGIDQLVGYVSVQHQVPLEEGAR